MQMATKLKTKDDSDISKREYLYNHILFGTIYGCVIYKLLPLMVPIAYLEQSLIRLIVCMILSNVIGIVFTYSHARSYINVAIDVITGMGVYTVLTIGNYLSGFVKCFAMVSIIITVLGIALIVLRNKKKGNNVKLITIRKLLKCVRLIHRNVGIFAVVMLIVLPISFHFVKEDKLLNKNILVNQIYGDEYCLKENIDTIKLIRDNDTFQSLNYQQKCEVIEAVLRCEGRFLGLCEFDIVFEDLPDSTLGQYNHWKRQITINAKQIRDGNMLGGSSEEILNTCLHEARHAYQCLLLELYVNATPEQRNLYVFTSLGVGDWIDEIDHENSSFEGIEEYMDYLGQEMEIDARDYAEREVLAYYSAIDELMEEQGQE